MAKKNKDEVEATIKYDGKSASLGSDEGNALMSEMVHKMIGVGGVMNPAKLLTIAQELRTLVINNSYRIPAFRQIADKLGSIETLIIESVGKYEDKKQEKLPLDKPEKVDGELS